MRVFDTRKVQLSKGTCRFLLCVLALSILAARRLI
jgi:hypothetical protein